MHETEVFGPCATLMAYDNVQEAVQLAARGGGSLALTCLAIIKWPALKWLRQPRRGMAACWSSMRTLVRRIRAIRSSCRNASMAGRGAGGGEELGGLRGLRFHMQRSAVQGSGKLLEALKQKAAEAAL